jgi:soluble lytic murein transglycosylase-like protein
MQVMPGWAGQWRGCGRDLYDIHDNLCNGTRILSWYLRIARGDERRALIGYNGCRGDGPRCWRYADKVSRLRHQVDAEMQAVRTKPPRFLAD